MNEEEFQPKRNDFTSLSLSPLSRSRQAVLFTG